MKTRRGAHLLMLVLVLTAMPAGASAGVALDATTVPGRALIKFAPGTTTSARNAVHARAGAHLIRRIPAIGTDLVRFPATRPLPSILSRYSAEPIVVEAEPNHVTKAALSPSDACHSEPCSGFPGQWHHRMTNTPFGWDAFPGRTLSAAEAKTIPRVTIAVLDTRIDRGHPDWVNGSGSADAADGGQLDFANARDWIPASKWGGSAAYHGTFVAGLAAAATGNGIDAAGVGFAARVLPLTILEGSGTGDAAVLAEAIVYAWQRGARVINLSLGILGDSSAVRDAIRLVTAGSTTYPPSLVVAAAGNNTGDKPFYPGSFPESMSVAGTDATDRRATCSNYNANVSVSAPADKLIGLTVMPTRRIQAGCGTSAATPQVSGLAGLLFMQDPSRTPAQVRALIERSADDLGPAGRDDNFGHGRINVERALRESGPRVGGVRAPVTGAGRATTVTAAVTGARVESAQMVIGRPDAEPVAMTASDGSLGGASEEVRATVTIPKGTPAGPQTVWVRAFDGERWGAASVGVVIVDGRAPAITNVSTTNALRATGQPLTVTFNTADDFSSSVAYAIEFAGPTGAIAHRLFEPRVGLGRVRASWLPPLSAPAGPYRIKIGVADEAGNPTTTETSGIVT